MSWAAGSMFAGTCPTAGLVVQDARVVDHSNRPPNIDPAAQDIGGFGCAVHEVLGDRACQHDQVSILHTDPAAQAEAGSGERLVARDGTVTHADAPAIAIDATTLTTKGAACSVSCVVGNESVRDREAVATVKNAAAKTGEPGSCV